MMKSDRSFAVFILSYGRCGRIITIDTLRTHGYTGDIVILTEKSQLDLYKEHYDCIDKVSVYAYDADEMYKITDMMDCRKGGTVTLARNYSFILAKKLGYTHFLMFEDDYRNIAFRWACKKNRGWVLATHWVKTLDVIFDAMLDMLDSTDIYTICFSQAGDFIGGVDAYIKWKNKTRKAMNSFFLRTDRPFKFRGRMNDDVNTYASEGSRGALFMTVREVSVEQVITQSSKGGLTGMYLENGTYTKSFYSVMCQPSCCQIIMMQANHKRIHHQVQFKYCVPRILPQSAKKSDRRITPIVREYGFREDSRL